MNIKEFFLSKKSDFILIIIAIVLLNIVLSNAHIRRDVTAQKTYTLSDASKSCVRALTQPLSIKVFFDKKLPTTYQSVSQYVKDILHEYSQAGSEMFSYTTFDMSKEENTKIASGFGCHAINVQQMSNNEAKMSVCWMSIAIVYGDAIDTMDGITSTTDFEYNLTTKIRKLVSTLDVMGAMGDGDYITLSIYKSSELDQFGISGLSDITSSVQSAVDTANKKYLGKIRVENALDSAYSSSNTAEGGDVSALANKYALQVFQWENKDKSTGVGVFGLVLRHGEDFRTVPISIARGLFGYGVTGLDELGDNIDKCVSSMFASSTRTIGYLLGHNEVETFDEKGNQTHFTKVLSDMYTFKDLNLDANEIPRDIDCVMINGPKEALIESELYKLDQFIMRGGNLIVFVDPFEMKQDNPYMPTTFNPIDSGLNRILSTYGVTLSGALVFDENCFKARQRGRDGGVQEFELFWAPMLSTRELLQSHPITKNLGYVIFLQPGLMAIHDWEHPTLGSKKFSDIGDVKATVLAVTSKNAWTQEKNIQLTPGMGAPYDKSIEKQEPLAVLLEGKFKSAFTKEVESKTNELDDEQKQKDAAAGNTTLTTRTHLTSGIAPAKILVIPSSFVVGDQIIDEECSEPVAIMMRNAVDYMNGNEELCLMRSKGVSFQTLSINTGVVVEVITWVCIVGVAVVALIIALLVWKKREDHKKAILAKFNPNDSRVVK